MSEPDLDTTAPSPPGRRSDAVVLAAVCGLGASAIMTQLVLMREMLSAFWGNEMILGIILGNWLLLTGIGAYLGRTAGRLKRPIRLLVWAQILVAVVPIVQVFLLRALRDVVFVRGAMVGVTETVVSAFVLLLPYCLVSGYLLALACSVVGSREGPSGIARVYVADSIGSIAGGVLFSFVLIRLFSHFGVLYCSALLNLPLACMVALCFARKVLAAIASAAILALVATMLLADLDAVSTALQYPGQRIVFRGNSPYGKLLVTESAGQLNFVENGLPIISTDDPGQVEETVHYAMAQRPDAARVLLVSGGVSGTAKEILKYGVTEVTYVELDPLIIDLGRRYLPDSLADRRIKVVNTDGRLFVKRTDQRYDVVIVDIPDPSTSQINRFYTREFFAEVRRILSPHGVLCFSLGKYENYVSKELASMLSSAHRTLKASFSNILVLPAARVFFLASNGAISADIATRIESAGVPTRLVHRDYLRGTFQPRRMAEIRRATSQPADLNTDFSPALYYYHLLYWISRFKPRLGLLEAALAALAVLLIVYLLRLRAVSLTIFVAGFADSALLVVLLLGFQILYGSLYHQLGVIVTMFMAGLAVGAFVMNRWLPRAGRKSLAYLAFALAAYAALLPLVLMALGRTGTTPFSFLLVQVSIPLLTFLLAVVVGMEFPLAGRIDFRGAAATASRLYTADFVGGCLGALLASTFLIPVIGVPAVCLLTAALNLIAAAVLLLRKA